ncbi:MAG: hypothetical protein KDB14_22115 [Planctomycetales bacterium]|nr:hypothetical protein [Planctomycetales bacterium]
MPASRRGLATLTALIAMAVTLSICLAVLRVQTTSLLVQHNARHRERARQAAITGLHVAFARMHESGWPGADTTMSETLDAETRCEVDYLTGDPALPASDTQRALRVTLQARGYCQPPIGPEIEAAAEAVVQLVPRDRDAAPANWSSLDNAAVLQWGGAAMEVNPPSQLAGLVRCYGPIELAPTVLPESNRPFRGRIDEVAIFSSALTPTDIAQIHSDCLLNQLYYGYSAYFPDSWWRLNEVSGAISAFNESYGWEGQYSGPLLEQPGCPGDFGNLAPQFDGHNDLVRIGDDGGFAQLTVIGWINEDGAGDGARSCIVGRGAGDADAEQAWSLSTVDDAGTRRLQFRIHAGGALHTLTDTSTAITPGTWHFVAATYDQSTMKLYIDGNQVATATQTGAIESPTYAHMAIGDSPAGSLKATYLRGLTEDPMGLGDDRPFPGSVETPLANLTSLQTDVLVNVLGTTMSDLAGSGQPPASVPGSLPTNYRLYPGGALYTAGTLGLYTSNTTLGPGASNPLGLFVANQNIEFGPNVSLTGTVLVLNGTLTLNGANISLAALTMPPLSGSSVAWQLPVAALEQGLSMAADASATVDGLLMSWGDTHVLEGVDGGLTLTGALATSRLRIERRSNWPTATSWWNGKLAQWSYDAAQGYAFESFPYFLAAYSLPPAPKTKIQPPPLPPTYHWNDWQTPLFQPAPGDAGLQWQIIRWHTGV